MASRRKNNGPGPGGNGMSNGGNSGGNNASNGGNSHHNGNGSGNRRSAVISGNFNNSQPPHQHNNHGATHGGRAPNPRHGQGAGAGHHAGPSNGAGRPYMGRNVEAPRGPVTRSQGPSNRIFSGEGPHYRGDGSDSRFKPHQRKTDEARPFSAAMPITIREDPLAKAKSDFLKEQFSKAHPEVTGEGFYMDFIAQAWARTPDRPLSRIHRSYGLRALLEYGDVDEVMAEVFHFLCGVLQCKYGDGYMADDMVMCDCDGKVSRCYATVHIEMARKIQQLEAKVVMATDMLQGKIPVASLSTAAETSAAPAPEIMNEFNAENIG